MASAVGACGDDKQYRNTDRPPSPIVVTAYIGNDRVSVSPADIGGGPIRLVATNQTGRSQSLRLETADDLGGSSPGTRQEAGPINPGDTGEIRATVEDGEYVVEVRGDGIEPARLRVGEERKTAQQDLMLP
jgi:hypothetical protein